MTFTSLQHLPYKTAAATAVISFTLSFSVTHQLSRKAPQQTALRGYRASMTQLEANIQTIYLGMMSAIDLRRESPRFSGMTSHSWDMSFTQADF